MRWLGSVKKLGSDWSTAILAVGQAGILPAVARKTTGKMLAAASWKPVPRPAHLLSTEPDGFYQLTDSQKALAHVTVD